MTSFTNELGNIIEVEVAKKDIDGVPGVYISIAGPTSSTTNHITRMEAEVISEGLKKVLSQ